MSGHPVSVRGKSHPALTQAGPGIAERWFGIGKIKPPAVDEVKKGEMFPMNLKLGDHRFTLDAASGKWYPTGSAPPVHATEPVGNPAELAAKDAKIAELQAQIVELQRQLADNQASKSAASPESAPSAVPSATASQLYEAEKRALEVEKFNVQVLHENNQLRFKNKVLMAMCAISEADYKALCKEAGIEPKDRTKRIAAIQQAQGDKETSK